ncbi:MAG: hypothetical protein QF805_03950 [Pirellulaceae bacterium]|nr:hypothetical protein [Pirellulaceae bacterium]
MASPSQVRILHPPLIRQRIAAGANGRDERPGTEQSENSTGVQTMGNGCDAIGWMRLGERHKQCDKRCKAGPNDDAEINSTRVDEATEDRRHQHRTAGVAQW